MSLDGRPGGALSPITIGLPRRAQPAPPSNGHVHRILVVDADPGVSGQLAHLLRLSGFAVSESQNGADALALARQQRPCVALVDMAMPVLDGPSFVRACRRDAGLQDLPILLMSGRGPAAIARAMGLSIAGYISKPFGVQRVLDAVWPIFREEGRERTSQRTVVPLRRNPDRDR